MNQKYILTKMHLKRFYFHERNWRFISIFLTLGFIFEKFILSTIILSSYDHSILIDFSQNFNVTYPTAFSPQHCLVLMIEKMSEILWLWKRCNRSHYRTILRLRLLWSRTPYCKTQCIQARYNYLDLFYSYVDKKESERKRKVQYLSHFYFINM